MTDADPKTLLQMAGAPLEPARLADAVVIMIDCQCEYVTGHLPLAGVEKALDACASLLARGRDANTRIIHIAHKGRPGGAFDRDASGGQIEDRAAPLDDEIVIEKALPNSFAGTNLNQVLEDSRKHDIILAGFMTHMCISSTARAALDLGYRTTIVSEATATRNLPNPAGGVIAASALQAASIAALADRFAIIAPRVGDIT